ncbi:MAG: VOC family protein [Candidatus Kariarchaeaceae archaeon]|jgi:uncharacterized glyoxalase superfamily protein PhnB
MTVQTKFWGVEPVLETNNLEETLEYYKSIGFTVGWTWPDEGTKTHASVSLGNEEDEEEHGHDHIHMQLTQADNPPVTTSGWLYFSVKGGIDELFEHFKSAGAEILSEPQDYSWGMREFNIKENNGHIFRFGQSTHEH